MIRSANVCKPDTKSEKKWPYDQYCLGATDEKIKKCGLVEHHWSGAESLEWYSGQLLRDTMHGLGSYHWRHRGHDDVSATYEGYFYCNWLHGYGTMSYMDGRTFYGLFNNDMRWGPGVQSHANLREDVGLWCGTQLIRLSWRPATPCIAPDFLGSDMAAACMDQHRIKLAIRKVNTIQSYWKQEILKRLGRNSQNIDKCSKLYPKYCTDIQSPLCDIKLFDCGYYDDKIFSLEEIEDAKEDKHNTQRTEECQDSIIYYAWNNNNIIINMMKHSFIHNEQTKSLGINVQRILCESRKECKAPGKHEMDCRTLLMASYLGEIAVVAQLINEHHVSPDVADAQGNTPIMYAMCGDQTEVIHFLVEAGANVDYYNDSCCTPLAVALMRFICVQRNIALTEMSQAFLAPGPIGFPLQEQNNCEWNIKRLSITPSTPDSLFKTPSKIARNTSSKRIKSLQSIKDQVHHRKKTEEPPKMTETLINFDESLSDDSKLYHKIRLAFSIKMTDDFTLPYHIKSNSPPTSVFDVKDLVKELNVPEDELKENSEKKTKETTVKGKEIIKSSKEIITKDNEKENNSDHDLEKDESKIELLTKINATILQLLLDGAKQKLVKCPQSALLMAVISNSAELVRLLVQYGANVNEKYDNILGYSPLDVAVSTSPYTQENFQVIQALLESGADTSHTLTCKQSTEKVSNIQGPNLLHAVILKKLENYQQEKIRRDIVEILLEHNCSPTTLFKSRSPIDIAMTKNFELFDLFIKCSKTDLNCVINDSNQSVLVKMICFPFFKSVGNTERLHILSNLLLFGADPFIPCYDGDAVYDNIFVLMKNTLNDLECSRTKPTLSTGKQEVKAKKSDKPKKDEKTSTKSVAMMVADDVEEYRLALEHVTECARLMYIRWLQAKLVKDLIKTTKKFVHRSWIMIIKECHNDEALGLWVTPQRCIDIWNKLSQAGLKYNGVMIIERALCIVTFMSKKYKSSCENVQRNLTADLKNSIDFDVKCLLRQQKINKISKADTLGLKKCYHAPELDNNSKKFNICFECLISLHEKKIKCNVCWLVSFCSFKCFKININRPNCHPCSNNLRLQLLPDLPDDSEVF